MCPREGFERAALERLAAAAGRFGRVSAVRAFGNEETLRRTSVTDVIGLGRDFSWSLEACGVDEDAADERLMRAVAAFAEEEGGESEGGLRLTTRRRLVAAEGEVGEAMARAMEATWRARAEEARRALPNAEAFGRDETVDAILRGRSRVAVVVTSDNDMKVAMDYAAAHGVCVVALGGLSPSGVGGRAAMKTKAGRARARAAGNEGITKAYWEALKSECERRQLSRLSLLQSCDGALVWDPNRCFDGVPGNVVAVWFPVLGGGVRRWYS